MALLESHSVSGLDRVRLVLFQPADPPGPWRRVDRMTVHVTYTYLRERMEHVVLAIGASS